MNSPPIEPAHGALLLLNQHFFGRDTIIHTINTLLKSTFQHNKDPVTHLIASMHREPLALCLTDKGLAPLKSEPTVIIPYAQMTKKQLTVLQEITTQMRISELYSTMSQMGGGLYVHALHPSRFRVYVDSVLLLFSTSVIMRTAKLSSLVDPRDLSNVVLQRIMSNVTIPRTVIMQAETMVREHMGVA